MNQALLQMRDVSKTYRIYSRPSDRLKHAFAPWTRPYRDHEALKGVSLDVSRGEAIGVIGRNGAGKSTLLQIAAGVLRPTSGRVTRTGRITALLELGTGFNPDFTGVENVRLAGALHGLDPATVEDRLPAIKAFADLGPFMDAPLRTYSSGMRARLGFAVMMHVDGDVMIVDEALAVGDAAFRQKCMRTMRERVRDQALLFVSHSANAVLGLCERAIWIDQGVMRADGPAKDVVRAYEDAMDAERSDAPLRPIRSLDVGKDERKAVGDARNVARRRALAHEGVHVFEFHPKAPNLETGAVEITSVKLRPTTGERINAPLKGGTDVTLRVKLQARSDLENVIVGFYVLNDDALPLFGENTLVGGDYRSKRLKAGDTATVEFRFDLPYLPAGDYAVTVAVATGDMEDHVYQVRLDEALMFRVYEKYFTKGLVGVPMRDISFATSGDVDGSLNDAA